MDTFKKVNIGMVAGAVLFGVVATLHFGQYCTPVHCYSNQREEMYQMVSATFSIIGLFFLLLPVGYFKMWLKTVLSWVLPLTIIVAYNPSILGTLFRFNMMDAVELMMYFLAAVTVLFITVYFLIGHVRAKSSLGNR